MDAAYIVSSHWPIGRLFYIQGSVSLDSMWLVTRCSGPISKLRSV